MPLIPLPGWNARGVLPPCDPISQTSANRSPYAVSLIDLVTRFADTSQRQAILQGLLDYRAALHELGLVEGFQWLDGSFTEHVELIEQRAPNDVDVVTFVHRPQKPLPTRLPKILTDHDFVKHQYRVDSYFVELDELAPHALVQQTAYWYSMWSHRRNEEWKGFLELNLDPLEDGEASQVLAQYVSERGATS
ncbi:MAG TPA: hypothetical protein VF271_09790 [Rhodanobacteraceae bacterium]